MTLVVLSGGGELLNRTGNIVLQWKEHFSTAFVKDAVFEDLRQASLISLADMRCSRGSYVTRSQM